MSRIYIPELLELPVSERLELVQELWDSVASKPDLVALIEEQRRELDRRLEAHRNSPNAADPWAEVRERLIERQ